MVTDRPSSPLVSIVICVYNGVPLIRETLESVLAQTYDNLEIVVIDDGSTDDTWTLLESFGARIRAIHQKNGGIAAARNTAVQAATGEFIALMDHDDLCEPERIALQVQLMLEYPDVVLCSSDFSAFDECGVIAKSYCSTYYARCSAANGGIEGRFRYRGFLGGDSEAMPKSSDACRVPVYWGDVYDEIALGNFIHPPTVMIRTSALKPMPLFDPAARLMCDWDWLARVARFGPFAYMDRPLLKYRRSTTQISSPRHWARASIDSLTVAQRIRDADPERYQRRRTELDSLIGDLTIDAAEANAEQHPATAIGLLRQSFSLRPPSVTRLIRIAIKLLLPAAIIQAIRTLRPRVSTAAH